MSEREKDRNESLGSTEDEIVNEWDPEDAYWREHWRARPGVSADRSYEFYQPGYRYGFESARRYRSRTWTDAESELRAGWAEYKHRGQAAWEQIKGAVKDGWDRVRHT
jgi:hypothetical protein